MKNGAGLRREVVDLWRDEQEHGEEVRCSNPLTVCHNVASDLHHCLIGASKNKPWLDVIENLAPACRKCNSDLPRPLDTNEARQAYYEIMCSKMGKERVDAFVDLANSHVRVESNKVRFE
jgi:hypothetical protein